MPEILGLEASVERVRFNPYTLGLTMRGFVVEDRLGDRFLATDEVYVNAQTSSLFKWAAVVKQIRIERPYIGLRRFDDGQLNFLEPAERGVEAAKQIKEIPRVVIQSFVLHEGSVDLEDRVIRRALRATGSNRARAATLVGMSRTSLSRRLEGRKR